MTIKESNMNFLTFTCSECKEKKEVAFCARFDLTKEPEYFCCFSCKKKLEIIIMEDEINEK